MIHPSVSLSLYPAGYKGLSGYDTGSHPTGVTINGFMRECVQKRAVIRHGLTSKGIITHSCDDHHAIYLVMKLSDERREVFWNTSYTRPLVLLATIHAMPTSNESPDLPNNLTIIILII